MVTRSESSVTAGPSRKKSILRTHSQNLRFGRRLGVPSQISRNGLYRALLVFAAQFEQWVREEGA